MKINPSIFKSYDIRGIYPQELNEETAEQIGRAFVKYANVRKIVVGQDARLSSPALFKALAKGITGSGADVYVLSQCPTELVYFAIGNYDYDAGIMITASHNSKEYNGFKMLKKIIRGWPTGQSIRIIRGKDLLEIMGKNNFPKSKKRSKIKKIDIWQDYLEHIFSFVGVRNIKPFKIVIDAGNGVAGLVVEKIKNKLPVKIISLNSKPDGNFPNRPPNPLLEGANRQIKSRILKEKADFGFMFDGDADRIFLINEKGELAGADIILLFLAEYFLKKNPGAEIVYNAICSKAVPEFVKKWGGRPVRTKVGFINVREGMIENNGIMGGELSAHYAFADNFFLDSGFIAFLILLEIISNSDKKVSEMVQELSPYAKSAEINFTLPCRSPDESGRRREVEDKEKIMEKIKEKYSDGKQDFLDGLTVGYKDWWFNLRPSNTEPLLRLTIEADTENLLAQKKKELSDFIGKLQ